MEIQYLKHHQIDKAKWDACIGSSRNRMVYAQSWYLDIVIKGWDALVAGNYDAVMPLTIGKKYGINYLYQPFFTQQLGVFSKFEIDKKTMDEFVKAIPAKFRFVEINLNKANNYPIEGFQIRKNVNIELKLDRPYKELSSGFSTNTKRNLKKAIQNDLTVLDNIPPEELIQLFRKNLGQEIKNIKTRHYHSLKQIMDKSLQEQNAEIYGVKSADGLLNAGAFFLQSFDSYIFLFSATNDESKENGAMFLIIDQFIKKHAGSSYTLDFEGSNIKSLARFYKGFGAEVFHYPGIKRNNLPGALKLFKK